MSSKLTFDASKVEPQKAFEPLPLGWYPFQMVESEVKPTAKEGGKQFSFELEVVSGEFKGRKVFDGYNIGNKNPVAEKIGQGQLSALCHAIGVMTFKDTKELHNIPFEAELKIEPAKDGYDARNRVKNVRPLEGAAATVATGEKPKWAGKKPADTAPATVTKTATPPPKKTPAAPPKKAEAAPVEVKDDREFYVLIEDKPTEATGTEIIGMLKDGMPAETPVVLVGEDDWKTAADYAIGASAEATTTTTAADEPAKPAGNRPPWAKKK